MRRSRSEAAGLILAMTGLLGAGSEPVVVGAPPAAAESLTALTLAEARERARQVSPRLGESRARLAAAAAELERARAGRLPEITLSGYYQRQSDVPELFASRPDGSRFVIFPNIPDNYGSHLDLSVPLYTGGRLAGGLGAATSRSTAADHDLETTVADLDLEVTEAYWNLAVARLRQEVLRRAIESFEAHLIDTRNRVRFGLAARNDELAVEVERDRGELDRLTAAGQERIAEANLARLLDLPVGSTLALRDRLETPGAELASESPTALVAEALAARSELRSLAAAVGVAEGLLRAERGDRWPQIGAQAGYLYARPNRNIPPFEDRFQDTWQVALRLSLSVFDGGRDAADVARTQAEAEAARWRLAGLEDMVRLEVEARLAELDTALAAVRVASRTVESARENLRVASDRYREGLIPSSERLDAETALLRAELDHTRALAVARLARAALDRSLGR